ncbi:unnamed protein product [Paramecium octaurelia]|uniref:RING-type domain-containing protein n=1 Tax=Paramecium octaurelia TaxID=43137 RepID=A0A8S1WJH8_PAROT|nr:unnamed protein product [Paramecium octaurelia]
MRNGLQKQETDRRYDTSKIIFPFDNIMIKKLRTQQFIIKDEKVECSICLKLVIENEIASQIRECKHTFHQLCLQKWYNINNKCPLCRQQI